MRPSVLATLAALALCARGSLALAQFYGPSRDLLPALCEQQQAPPPPAAPAAAPRGPGLEGPLLAVRRAALALLAFGTVQPGHPVPYEQRVQRYAALARAYNALGSAVTRRHEAPPPGDMARVALAVMTTTESFSDETQLVARSLRWLHCEDPAGPRHELCLGLARLHLEGHRGALDGYSHSVLGLVYDLRRANPADSEALGTMAALLDVVQDHGGAEGAYRAQSEMRGAPANALVRARLARGRLLREQAAPVTAEALLGYALDASTRERAAQEIEAMVRLDPDAARYRELLAPAAPPGAAR